MRGNVASMQRRARRIVRCGRTRRCATVPALVLSAQAAKRVIAQRPPQPLTMSRGSTVTTIEDIRFPTPDEIEGFWAFDKMHAPRPLHPLSQDLVMSTLAEGFTKAQAEYDSPVVASNQAINHYFFMSFHP